jgi:hypothetical protein
MAGIGVDAAATGEYVVLVGPEPEDPEAIAGVAQSTLLFLRGGLECATEGASYDTPEMTVLGVLRRLDADRLPSSATLASVRAWLLEHGSHRDMWAFNVLVEHASRLRGPELDRVVQRTIDKHGVRAAVGAGLEMYGKPEREAEMTAWLDAVGRADWGSYGMPTEQGAPMSTIPPEKRIVLVHRLGAARAPRARRQRGGGSSSSAGRDGPRDDLRDGDEPPLADELTRGAV